MNLIEETKRILNQIIDLCAQLEQEAFTNPLPILSGNTLGKHVRHIIEFYDCLVHRSENNIINYENRKHDLLLESNPSIAVERINLLLKQLQSLNDEQLTLAVNYSGFAKDIHISTSFSRELVYNIEHATHHLAIIKIAVITVFKKVHLPADFGIAYSTIKYQNQCAQ